MLTRPPLFANNPGIMDRIDFIKKMIQTHQTHLLKDEKKFITQTDEESSGYFKNHQLLKRYTSQRKGRSQSKQFQFDQVRNSSNFSSSYEKRPYVPSRSYTLQSQSDISNISFSQNYDSYNRPKLKNGRSNVSHLSSDVEELLNNSFEQQARDDSTSRLKFEELKVTREHLSQKTLELQQGLAQLKEKDSIISKLQEQVANLELDIRKVNRERDDLQSENTHLVKKLQKAGEDEEQLKQREAELKRDLEDARNSIVALRQFEGELQTKEKQLLMDWQLLEKEKSFLKEKQASLLLAEKSLEEQVGSIQALKQRIEKQEAKLKEKCQNQIRQLEERAQLLDDQERSLRLRENQLNIKQQEQFQKEEQLMSMQMNEEIWNKKILAEMKQIEMMKQQLRKKKEEQ